MELLSSPFGPKFDRFIETVESDCVICSPYITIGPVQRLADVIVRKRIVESLSLRIITDISAANLVSGSTDIGALLLLASLLKNVEITYLPRVHAKVYISGESIAMISSANYTDAGCFANLEYGVWLTDPTIIMQVRDHIEGYARLGGKVSRQRLDQLRGRVDMLRLAVAEEQRSVSAKLRELSAELRRDAEDELIRVRLQGRAVHAVFAETILFLLKGGDMSTVELHRRIQGMHPDLCNDMMDRVIDGQHFGRLWKHQVRTAQQHLKHRGLVTYHPEKRMWNLAK